MVESPESCVGSQKVPVRQVPLQFRQLSQPGAGREGSAALKKRWFQVTHYDSLSSGRHARPGRGFRRRRDLLSPLPPAGFLQPKFNAAKIVRCAAPLRPVSRSGLSLARNDCFLSEAAATGSTFPPCSFDTPPVLSRCPFDCVLPSPYPFGVFGTIHDCNPLPRSCSGVIRPIPALAPFWGVTPFRS